MFLRMTKKKMIAFFSNQYKDGDLPELTKATGKARRSWIISMIMEWVFLLAGSAMVIAALAITYVHADDIDKGYQITVFALVGIGLVVSFFSTVFFIYTKYQGAKIFSLDILIKRKQTPMITQEEAVRQISTIKAYSYDDVVKWQQPSSTVTAMYAIHVLKQFKPGDEVIPIFLGLTNDLFSTWKQQVQWIGDANQTGKTSHQKIVQIIQWLQDHNLTIKDLSFSALEDDNNDSDIDGRLLYWINATKSNINGWNKVQNQQ